MHLALTFLIPLQGSLGGRTLTDFRAGRVPNPESMMQRAAYVGRYRPSDEAYGQLFKRMGESSHQSCLLLTSREQPQEVARLERPLPSSEWSHPDRRHSQRWEDTHLAFGQWTVSVR